MNFTQYLLLVLLASHGALALNSKFLTQEQLLEYMINGHVYLKDVLPQLREESFHVAHTHARNEASKAYERYFLERVGCNETGMDYLSRVEEGDGAVAMKDCMDYLDDIGDLRDLKPFYQLVDLHEHSKLIGDIAMGEHLASIAADLLQVNRVRLFQTRSFRKVPSKDTTMEEIFNHATYLHTDLLMVPIDTNDFFTFWCPLRNVTSDDSILTYARGSHRDVAYYAWDHFEEDNEDEDDDFDGGRCRKPPVFYLEYEPTTSIAPIRTRKGEKMRSEHQNEEMLRIAEEYDDINDSRWTIDVYPRINVGDCVAHHGWLLHGATSQKSSRGAREAIALSYVNADEYKLKSNIDFLDGDLKDEIMFWQWYYDVEGGAIIDHPKLPLIWPQPERIKTTDNSTKKCDVCSDN